MAYAATVLDEFRLSYDAQKIDAHENRMSFYGAYETFKKDTPNLIPGYQELVNNRASAARTVSIPILTRKTFSPGSVRACTAKTDQGTSAYVTPSWTTVESGFMMVPAEHQGNYISYQNAFNHLAKSMERAFLLDADTDAVAYLVANLSGINNAEDNPYSSTSYYMQVALANHSTFFNELSAIMLANDITEPNINIVASPRMKALVQYNAAQGNANSANLGFQFAGFNFAYSNQVTISTAYHSTAYAVPQGSLAYLSWVDIDSRMSNKSGDGKEWYVQELPLLGHNVGVLFQSTCGDKSSLLSGLQATLVESFSFSFDRSFVSSYDAVSTVDPGVIYGIELLKT